MSEDKSINERLLDIEVNILKILAYVRKQEERERRKREFFLGTNNVQF